MKWLCFAALLAVGAAVGPAPNAALGQDLTGSKIEQAVADDIAPKLKEAGYKAVTLEPITWAGDGKPAAAGAGLAQALAESLAANGIGLTAKAAGVPVLGGTLARVVDEESKPPAPALKLVLTVTVDGKPVVGEVPLLILMEGVIRVRPVKVSFPPKGTPAERVAALVQALDPPAPPPPPPPGESVTWSPDKTVGLELLMAKTADVSKTRAEAQPEEEEGKVAKLFARRPLDAKSRVPVADGESARFRLINKNPFAIAGELRVAGVDWSEFADVPAPPADDKDKAKPADEKKPAKQYLLVMVPANSEVIVRGWYRTESSSLAFDVKKLPVAAAGRQTADGVVSLTYHAGWKKGETPPAGDEDYRQSDEKIVPGGVQKDKFERVELRVGKIRGMVAVEYGESK